MKLPLNRICDTYGKYILQAQLGISCTSLQSVEAHSVWRAEAKLLAAREVSKCLSRVCKKLFTEQGICFSPADAGDKWEDSFQH